MQNPIQKTRQFFIVFEKPGMLSEKLKYLRSSKYHRPANISTSEQRCGSTLK